MNKKLLKCILNYAFYQTCYDKLHEDLFDHDEKLVYKVIKYGHEKYKTNLDEDMVRKLYDVLYAASTTANTRSIATILDDIKHTAIIPDDMAHDIIIDAYRKRSAEELADAALKVWNGEDKTFANIRKIFIEKIENVQEIPVAYEEVEFDLPTLLAQSSSEGLYPFRLTTLANRIPGMGPGNFGITFARPNLGKSAFLLYEAVGHILAGRKVAYFGNEEPANRLYLRLLCSLMQQDAEWIRNNQATTISEFSPLKNNLRMMDCVGMDITDVETWAHRNKPDVIIMDQLDKFNIRGSFQRTDEKLGEVYTYAREIAKRNKCVVWGACQASAEAEGMRILNYSMMAGSKTAKAAEADIIIGIGRNEMIQGSDGNLRTINICKNKINGEHTPVECSLDSNTVMFLP